ncbi:hypothetical protein GCM10027290_05180 [Micromonospora sonneratiae]|uniref:Uncharacterized protein n=1 Tax=Micromonospora sonneratiae TaxID=1184706 RepID=A0ABW3YQW9_9ACTN
MEERLLEIVFSLPRNPRSRTFLSQLRTLLADVAYAGPAETENVRGDAVDRLILTPPNPADARPVTTFELADTSAPQVVFDTGQTIGIQADDTSDTPVPPALVELSELTHRLAGHIRRVDHTGVNLPADHTTPEQWRNLVNGLASASTMYRYPSGEEWPFILPSTSDELVGDIRTFVTGREPRFELVYDRWSRKTTWQFALWTDLTRTELERLFPGPEGTTIGGLEEIFRVVAVQSPWPGLGIRFDLCYRIEDSPSDWETGEWLVTEGGRIR